MCDFEQNGFAILPGVFGPAEIASLIEAISQIGDDRGIRSRGGVYAIRNLLEASRPVRELAESPKVRSIVEGLLSKAAFPVRGTLFDKIAGANWLVPWHQDLTVCVTGRVDVPGYGPWTVKGGLCHVQPPVTVLEGMLSVRIHLDDCQESNGALRVIPGTHRLGRLSPAQVKEQSARPGIACAARAGDVLLMRPLLLHASSAASRAAHRRVVHIDYASSELDGGLRWLTPQA